MLKHAIMRSSPSPSTELGKIATVLRVATKVRHPLTPPWVEVILYVILISTLVIGRALSEPEHMLQSAKPQSNSRILASMPSAVSA